MLKFKNLVYSGLLLAATMLTSCLHIIEEVTFRENGSGKYAMTLDMSEVKSMMEMMKSMTPDSSGQAAMGGEAGAGDQMSQMGAQMSSVTASLSTVKGITNVVPLNDTSNYQFGYVFEFANVEALNKALKVVGKETFESNGPDAFSFDKKKFERYNASDFGAELKKQLSAGAGEAGGEEGGADMMKMFFADMTYKQIYHFDRKVKKSTHSLSELSDDDKTLTITLKPFDEEQAKNKVDVATAVKLK